MSIPKEPRQLMINLMYLVLTAMLALNVSAEIINAFFALNKGINNTNGIVDNSNIRLKASIDAQAKAYSNPATASAKSGAEKAIEISKEFASYITSLNDEMVEAAGGPNPAYTDGRPVRYKDKDVTTRMFLPEGQNRGVELETKINETRAKYLALVSDPKERADLEKQIALGVETMEEISKVSKAKTWSEYKFKQMPVAAVMPLFTKLRADAKNSETSLLNYFADKVNIKEIKFDGFKVAIAPKNGYIIQGEKFEADVYLAAYSTNPGSGVSISVNGGGIATKDGVGHYTATAGELGKKKVTASASIKNPMTGETKTVNGEFEYEVGRRSVAISADKMNVFYIGVDNPVSVSAAGVSSNLLKASGSGVSLTDKGDGKYNVTASAPNPNASITVSAPGLQQTFPFRVKRIPDPVAKLGNKMGGSMGNGEFKAQSGVLAWLEGFDFDAKCQIQSYRLTRVPKRQDPVVIENSGGSFNGQCRSLADAAKPGDIYYIDDVKARCPGDQSGRQVNSMVFTIK
jgi:gliding motility-associated protein GldM